MTNGRLFDGKWLSPSVNWKCRCGADELPELPRFAEHLPRDSVSHLHRQAARLHVGVCEIDAVLDLDEDGVADEILRFLELLWDGATATRAFGPAADAPALAGNDSLARGADYRSFGGEINRARPPRSARRLAAGHFFLASVSV